MGVVRRRRKPLVWLLVSILGLTLLGAFVFSRPFDMEARAAAPAGVAPDEPPVPPPPPLPGKRMTFLVMGVDDRPDSPGRADTMVVASYDPATNRLAMVSLARDTWAQIPGHGFDKINHAYAFGGEQLAVSTVQRLLGIPIDYYVTVSFSGFKEIVDALGGVEIDAEKRLYYVDPYDTGMGPDGLVIDIEAGKQQMDGDTALKYARFRMDDEGDFGRMRRQQQVMKALMKSAARPAVIARLPQLIPALAGTIKTNLSIAEMLKLAAAAPDVLSEPLHTNTFGGEPRIIGGIYYVIADLVTSRKAAYETLVGTAPTEEFLQRAREEQAAYTRSIALAKAEEEPAAGEPAADPEGETRTEPADGDKEGQPKSEPGAQPGQGKTNKPTQPGPVTTPKPPPTTTKPSSRPITVAVIDASGQRLGAEYVAKLKAAGFRVARVARSEKAVSRTVGLDHAGQAGAAERVKAVIPQVLWVSAPDPQAGEAVEIILGADLAPSR